MSSPEALRTCLARATRRRRARYALEGFALGGAAALVLGATIVALARVRGELTPVWLPGGMILVTALAALISALRPMRALRTATMLDAHHGLRSRLATGLELAPLPHRTPFEDLALEEAERSARAVDPRAPFPFERPRATRAGLVASALFAISSALPARQPAATPAPPPAPLERNALLDPETLAAFEDELREELSSAPDAEAQSLKVRLEALLDGMEDGSLSKTDALSRLGDLVEELERIGAPDVDRLDAALGSIGDSLGRGGALLEDAARALREARLVEAARHLREAASDLDAERVLTVRERLATKRALLESAATDRALEQAERRREQAEARLREQKRRGGDQGEEAESLLKKRERELEAAREQEESLREDRRRLERLRRELEEAAEGLDGERSGEASEALRRAAEALQDLEALRRMAKDLDALRRLAEQLRDSVRQAGQEGMGPGGEGGGAGQGERMQRFSLRAAGEEPGEGNSARLRLPSQAGGDGRGQEDDAAEGGAQAGGGDGQGAGDARGHEAGASEGERAERGASGGSGAPGEPGGAKPSGSGEPTLELTPAGPGENATAELELPSFEQRPASGGSGSGGAGGGHGEGYDPTSGPETNEKVAHDDSRIDGVAGEGPTRSQLILGAADRGFASRGYRKVHADYSSHAEEVLEDESIPPGYRFYVRRYFQLIRPRDGRDR